MTIKSLAKLSVFALLINYIGKAEADSFSLAVRGTACADVSAEQTRSEIRYRAYDKAVLLAVKILRMSGRKQPVWTITAIMYWHTVWRIRR